MTVIASPSPGFSRYIQADVYHRINRELPKTNTIADNMVGCTNEALSLAERDFIQAPDKAGSVYGLIHTQAQSELPEIVRSANTTVECRELFKSVLGMLSTMEDKFTSSENACYQQLCERFCSEIQNESQAFNNPPSLSEHVKNITSDDKLFWQKAAPLLETYSKDIVENLTAHILNQSIKAWCEHHNIADLEWARSNIEQVFRSNIRMCLNVLDDEVIRTTKAATSTIQDNSVTNAALVRFGYMKMFDAIASIPLSLRHQTPSGVATPSTTENPVRTPDSTDDMNGHHSPQASTSLENINADSSNVTATSYGGNSPTMRSDPWSAVTEKLLASDKITQEQCFLLLKDLIATMGERRETATNFFDRYPLLSQLNGVSTQDLPNYSTLPNGNSITVKEPLFVKTDTVSPTAPVTEHQPHSRVQLKRLVSSGSSLNSDMPLMSPPRSPLENFQISTMSPWQNINAVASPVTYSTDLSPVEGDRAPVVNDDAAAIEEKGRSSAGHAADGINSDDLALLKRWLGVQVQENEQESESIDKLILRGNGNYTETIEHFLERAFLAEAGTEERSDMQQIYINKAFSKLKSNPDFSKLSFDAQALVEKFSEKRNFRVLTTTPGVRRSLSSQLSRG